MKVAIGADHGGFRLKGVIIPLVAAAGHEVIDAGAHGLEPDDDYPDFVCAVAEIIRRREARRGIIICGSGVGAAVAASKFPGIRASVCHDTYSAHQGVEHDNMNVLCLGGRIIGDALAHEIVVRFLQAEFSGEARHQRRLDKINRIEARYTMGRHEFGEDTGSAP